MRIGLVAGEASGDLLGAGLIRAIRERNPAVTFEGVAGPEMIAAGCDPMAAVAMPPTMAAQLAQSGSQHFLPEAQHH